jgi:hypothetical protein
MRLLLVIALAACSTPGRSGPAWPKPTAREADGGESLSPRAAARSVAARSDDDHGDDRSDEAASAAPAAGPSARADRSTVPVELPAGVMTPEDQALEEMVIEIEETEHPDH